MIENDLSDDKFRFVFILNLIFDVINLKFLKILFQMISYHNPLTNRQHELFPVLDGNTLKHAIHKRSDAELIRH